MEIGIKPWIYIESGQRKTILRPNVFLLAPIALKLVYLIEENERSGTSDWMALKEREYRVFKSLDPKARGYGSWE